MKTHQRLDYEQLAKVLAERGLVEPRALKEALDLAAAPGGTPFPEALVSANLVADWELSRIVCELYNLPFLTVEMCRPQEDAFEGLDEKVLMESGLVPLSRHGQVLTICMPGIVPAETLGFFAATLDLVLSPVVGTVHTNRVWLNERFAEEPAPPLPSYEAPQEAAPAEPEPVQVAAPPMPAVGWSDIFDEADAAVLHDLESEEHKLTIEGGEGSPEDPSLALELSATQFMRRTEAALPDLEGTKLEDVEEADETSFADVTPTEMPKLTPPSFEIDFEDPDAA